MVSHKLTPLEGSILCLCFFLSLSSPSLPILIAWITLSQNNTSQYSSTCFCAQQYHFYFLSFFPFFLLQGSTSSHHDKGTQSAQGRDQVILSFVCIFIQALHR